MKNTIYITKARVNEQHQETEYKVSLSRPQHIQGSRIGVPCVANLCREGFEAAARQFRMKVGEYRKIRISDKKPSDNRPYVRLHNYSGRLEYMPRCELKYLAQGSTAYGHEIIRTPKEFKDCTVVYAYEV